MQVCAEQGSGLCMLTLVQLFATPWAPLSMGLSRQEYWSGLAFSPPGHLPDPGIEPILSCIVGGFFTAEPPGKPSVLLLLLLRHFSHV